MREGRGQIDIDDALRDALREVLEEQLESLLEVLLKEVAGVSAQILGLKAGASGLAAPQNSAGTSGDLAELIFAATSRGGRFF